jgi:hypothetical protein
MFSKKRNTVFWQKKWDAIVPPLLCMNQEYISTLKSERLPLFWYKLIIFINLAIVLASRIIQWQNPELIYAEILNKTSLALMFTSNFKFFYYLFHLLSSRLFMLYFVAWPNFLVYLA